MSQVVLNVSSQKHWDMRLSVKTINIRRRWTAGRRGKHFETGKKETNCYKLDMVYASLALSWTVNYSWMISFVRGMSAVGVKYDHLTAKNIPILWINVLLLIVRKKSCQG